MRKDETRPLLARRRPDLKQLLLFLQDEIVRRRIFLARRPVPLFLTVLDAMVLVLREIASMDVTNGRIVLNGLLPVILQPRIKMEFFRESPSTSAL